MTETTHPQLAPSPHRGASTSAAIVTVAEARGEWGNRTLLKLVRIFARAALRKPAVADYLREYIFDITSGDEPPADVGNAMRTALDEVLAVTTSEDRAQVAVDLLAYARECIEDDGSVGTPPTEGWAPPALRFGELASALKETVGRTALVTTDVSGENFAPITSVGTVDAFEEERDLEDWFLTLEVEGSTLVQFSRRYFVHAIDTAGELRVRQPRDDRRLARH